MPLDDATRDQLASLIASHEVLLFMKGNRDAPQCGFSATVVRILDTLVPDYRTVDVLREPAVREGIKEFSSWPTIPQLYVKGEFVGGCDIVQELFESGELHGQLGVERGSAATPPRIEIRPAAAEALQRSYEQNGGEGREIHLSIDARHRSQLFYAPAGADEIRVESAGIALYLDPVSAQRADGVSIDLVETPQGTGFQIENPSAPRVRELSVEELHERQKRGEPFELLDVRTPEERARASIPRSLLLTDEEVQRLQSLPRDTVLVFHCHHGGRSQRAAEHFAALGFREVYNVVGGIDAWAARIDSSVPRY